jgi:GntR family transcriptional regulator
MHLRIQRGSATPVSRQIDAQIRAQIFSGVLRPDESLPSVRQLAKQLGVNVNTVVRVYERLAAAGLVDMRQGDGTYVATREVSADSAQLADHCEHLAQEFDAIVRRGQMLGLSSKDLRRLLSESIQRVQREIPAAERASRKQGDSP